MPRPGIPPALIPEVLAERGRGRSHREIAAWLRETHGVRVTHVTVGKLLREHREDRAELTKEVVREELGKTLTADLHELGEARKRLLSYEERAAAENDLDVAIRANRAIRENIDTVLKYSGAGEPDAAPQAVGVVVLPAETDE